MEKENKENKEKKDYTKIIETTITPKKKFLKKSKEKIKGISPKAVLRTFEGGSLVREGRTGYFNDEYEKEVKWLN
jgi:hypothetical protein